MARTLFGGWHHGPVEVLPGSSSRWWHREDGIPGLLILEMAITGDDAHQRITVELRWDEDA